MLLFAGETDDVVELAYAVGAPFQGRGVGSRSVSAALRLRKGFVLTMATWERSL